MKKDNELWLQIDKAYKQDKKAHPNWPDHPAAQAGRVVEASGGLMKVSMEWKYRRDANEVVQDVQKDRMQEKAIETVVTALRFLDNLKSD